MPIQIENAQNIDRPALHAAMLDAFSDYDIPLQPHAATVQLHVGSTPV